MLINKYSFIPVGEAICKPVARVFGLGGSIYYILGATNTNGEGDSKNSFSCKN